MDEFERRLFDVNCLCCDVITVANIYLRTSGTAGMWLPWYQIAGLVSKTSKRNTGTVVTQQVFRAHRISDVHIDHLRR
jgi:hypothetical protein